MKKSLALLILFSLVFFLLCSCEKSSSYEKQMDLISDQDITYNCLQLGNVIDDGKIAVFLNFTSKYKVDKMELKGALLDRKGNAVYVFDDSTTFATPSLETKFIIMVDKALLGKISEASFVKINAYTTETFSSESGTPSAVVSSTQTSYTSIIIIAFILFVIVVPVSVITISYFKNYADDNDDNTDKTQENKPPIKKFKKEDIISNTTKFDKFEEIKKYKELLDAGIITQEEFEAKKKELL